VQKSHNLADKEPASFAEVIKEGDEVKQNSHARNGSDGKKMGDGPRKAPATTTATMTNGEDGHPSYAQVVVEGDEEEHHRGHPAISRDERQQNAPDVRTIAQHHEDHASYAEVAAEGVVDPDH
jgi:hypothetical protein